MTEVEAKAEQLMIELSAYLNKNDIDTEGSLYHYTSFTGLTGILQSRQLWMTDHKYLNDPSEIEHGKNLILNFIENHLRNNFELKDYLQKLVNHIIENGYKTYLTAFCECGDYLPAWRYYGNNGAGFSIGFRKEYFSQNPNDSVNERDITFLYKVEYNNIHFQQIQDIFDYADKIFPKWHTKIFTDLKPYISALVRNLIAILPCIKNEDYRDEKEWRQCMLRLYFNGQWYPTELPMERLIIDTPPLRVIPFLKDLKTTIPRLQTLQFDYSDIDTIYVGPRLDFLTAKLAIEKMLLDAGINDPKLKNITITKSERPYQ